MRVSGPASDRSAVQFVRRRTGVRAHRWASRTSAEVLSAVAFAASICIVLYALVEFVTGSPGALAKHCVFIQAVLVPPITVFFVEVTLTHLAVPVGDRETRPPLQPRWDWANRLSIPMPLALVISCGTAWRLGMKRRRSESPAGRIEHNVRTALPYISVAIVSSVIVRSILALPTTSPAARIAPVEAWLWVVLLRVVLVIQSMGLSLQKGVESPFPGRVGQDTI